MKTEQRIETRNPNVTTTTAGGGAPCRAEKRNARKLSANAKGQSNAPKPNRAYARLSARELRRLVAAAKRFDAQAIAKLCDAFKPLILKEAYAAHIVARLGDDAVNTAWEIFLGFVQAYSKRSYRIFPTLAQMNLRYGLLRRVSRLKSVQDLALLDAADAEGNRIFNPSDRNGLMDALDDKTLVKYLLAELSEKQRQVIVETIVKGYTLEEYALQNGIKYCAAYRLRERGLALLRAKLG